MSWLYQIQFSPDGSRFSFPLSKNRLVTEKNDFVEQVSKPRTKCNFFLSVANLVVILRKRINSCLSTSRCNLRHLCSAALLFLRRTMNSVSNHGAFGLIMICFQIIGACELTIPVSVVLYQLTRAPKSVDAGIFCTFEIISLAN